MIIPGTILPPISVILKRKAFRYCMFGTGNTDLSLCPPDNVWIAVVIVIASILYVYKRHRGGQTQDWTGLVWDYWTGLRLIGLDSGISSIRIHRKAETKLSITNSPAPVLQGVRLVRAWLEGHCNKVSCEISVCRTQFQSKKNWVK